MIFSFFQSKRREKEKTNEPRLKVDLHSHLIPGLDDGAKSMDESMNLLKGMVDLGYKKIITTPHVMIDAYKNNPEIIRKGLNDLRDEATREGIVIDIDAAAEYYLDDGFNDILEKGDVLTVKGNYLLFETSYFAKPIGLEEMIFAIASAGYKPLMAHPERYRYIKDPLQEYSRFKELGVFFQVNLNSFGGHYGKDAKEKAEFLNSHGLIDFLGSDVHHMKQVNTLSDIFLLETYRNIFENNKILNNELV